MSELWKKIAVFLGIAVFTAFGLSACGDKEDDNKIPPSAEKKTLVFQVDEGMGGYEFVAGCKGDTQKMDVILNNVYSGIEGLKENYDVCVLIYPNWYYKAEGWEGKDPSEGVNKLDPSFLYAMDFFKPRGIGVYLEIMSSGIYTNQNGELGRLPIVDINCGTEGKERREVKGISLDMHTVSALKAAYPDTFRGLRFHELIGTDNLGRNPPDDPYWGNHGYAIEQEDVYRIIDTCKEAGLKLIWSDHTFDVMYEATKSFWKTRVEYASEQLGKDLTVMWANNAGEATRYLKLGLFESFKRDFPNSTIGFGNQNWFSTALAQNMQKISAETDYPECNMPIELTAGFTLKAFEHGASVVQYEPPYQLFNFHRSLYMMADLGLNSTLDGYQGSTAGYERAPDYSPRLELKRLVDILNNKDDSFNDIENFFDTSSGKISANLAEDPPKVYAQTTVGALGESGITYYDKYNNDTAKWLNQNENRFGDWFLNPTTEHVSRISIGNNDFDDVAVAVERDGKIWGEFYNERSGLILKDDRIFADNENGSFVGFATANLIQEYVENAAKDTDEIVVARKKSGAINLSLYKVINNGRFNGSVSMVTKVAFTEVSRANMYLTSFFGGTQIPEADFMGLFGVRNNNSVSKTSGKRPTDGLAAIYRTEAGVRVKGKRYSTALTIDREIPLDGDFQAAAFGDADLDARLDDELLISVLKDGKTELRFYEFDGDTAFVPLPETLSFAEPVRQLFVLRKSFYQYDSAIR